MVWCPKWSPKKIVALDGRSVEPIICERGDADKDGVCDDWDRELDTPLGARVDGAGKALDMDLDGVIDLNDACVTVPGLAKIRMSLLSRWNSWNYWRN